MEEQRVVSWEELKEHLEFFLEVLKRDTLTEETKLVVNEQLQMLIRMWANPVMVIGKVD